MRAFDGMGSSLDLPFPQWMFTMLGITHFEAFPMTPTVASEYKATISFRLAPKEVREKGQIVYIAPQYGIDRLIRGKDDIGFFEKEDGAEQIYDKVTVDAEHPHGRIHAQGLAPAYIFTHIFDLTGLEIEVESIDLFPKEGGGLESSNVANIALVSAASILSGANLSEPDIFSLAVKIENDELGGLTGGQGHWSALLGGIFAHVWFSGVKSTVDGNLVNTYSAFSIPLIRTPEAVKILEEHFMFAQAGKHYIKGKPQTGRAAQTTNELWTMLVEDLDEVGFPRFYQKIAQTAKGIKALMAIEAHAKGYYEGNPTDVAAVERALQDIIESLIEYVNIRNDVALRGIELTFDAYHGRPVPEFAKEYHRREFFTDKDDGVKREWDRLTQEIMQQSDKPEPEARAEAEQYLRTHSLYNYGKIGPLVDAAKQPDARELLKQLSAEEIDELAQKGDVPELLSRPIGIMSLGAGGPGTVNIAVSSVGRLQLLAFFRWQEMEQLTTERIREVVEDKSDEGQELRGYTEFKVSLDPVQYRGFEQAGFELPEKPQPAKWSEVRRQKFQLGLAPADHKPKP
jgi:hypothetical protein